MPFIINSEWWILISSVPYEPSVSGLKNEQSKFGTGPDFKHPYFILQCLLFFCANLHLNHKSPNLLNSIICLDYMHIVMVWLLPNLLALSL